MKILLIQPPYRHGRYMLPTGLAYVAAYLLKAGHDVRVLDADAFTYTNIELEHKLSEEKYDVIGIGCIVTAYNFVLQVSDFIKKTNPSAKIVVGGTLATYSYDALLKNSKVDVCVIGEGELTAVDLVRTFSTGGDLRGVDGIAYMDGSTTVLTKPRSLISNLDELPYPARDLFHAEDVYSRNSFVDSIFKTGRNINISGGRGCPYSCTFCSYDRRVRLRSAPSLIDELKMLKEKYRIKNFNFEDDLFMADIGRVEDFCHRLIREKLNLHWVASGRVNLVNKNILSLMRRAGCYMLGFGLESGSTEMLKSMKKFTTSKQNEDAIRMTREAGILPGGSWILGMPGENRETVAMSVGLYKRINRYRNICNEFFFATPYPGTELYKAMQNAGKIGDEHDYLVKISKSGDAFKFAINCTTSFTDEELTNVKREIDREVMKDFYLKHPLLWFFKVSRLYLVKKAIIFLKVNGAKRFIEKIKDGLSGKDI